MFQHLPVLIIKKVCCNLNLLLLVHDGHGEQITPFLWELWPCSSSDFASGDETAAVLLIFHCRSRFLTALCCSLQLSTSSWNVVPTRYSPGWCLNSPEQRRRITSLTGQFPLRTKYHVCLFPHRTPLLIHSACPELEVCVSAEGLPCRSGPSLLSVCPPCVCHTFEEGLSPSHFCVVPLHQQRAFTRHLVCCFRTGLSQLL